MSSKNGEKLNIINYNDHTTRIKLSMNYLMQMQDFRDVTLICENRSFSLHKLMLAALSPYFYQILKDDPTPHPVLVLNDISPKIMEKLVIFIYEGTVFLDDSEFPQFVKIADKFQIIGVTNSRTKLVKSQQLKTLIERKDMQQLQNIIELNTEEENTGNSMKTEDIKLELSNNDGNKIENLDDSPGTSRKTKTNKIVKKKLIKKIKIDCDSDSEYLPKSVKVQRKRVQRPRKRTVAKNAVKTMKEQPVDENVLNPYVSLNIVNDSTEPLKEISEPQINMQVNPKKSTKKYGNCARTKELQIRPQVYNLRNKSFFQLIDKVDENVNTSLKKVGFTCIICGDAFPGKNFLSKHMMAIHSQTQNQKTNAKIAKIAKSVKFELPEDNDK